MSKIIFPKLGKFTSYTYHRILKGMHMDTCHLLKTKKTKYDNNNID